MKKKPHHHQKKTPKLARVRPRDLESMWHRASFSFFLSFNKKITHNWTAEWEDCVLVMRVTSLSSLVSSVRTARTALCSRGSLQAAGTARHGNEQQLYRGKVTSWFKRWNEETQDAARGLAISWVAEISHWIPFSPYTEEETWIPHRTLRSCSD